MSSSQYSILFEPVRIGPHTARNRFYQVPHCCGLGHLRPQAHAAMRGLKAEGGWAVVSTEEAEIHPSSDLSPYPEQRIWDENDIPALKLMTDAVHDKGALAAIELVHNGSCAPNLYSRIPPLSPVEMPLSTDYPKQARKMNRRDIRELRKWHRAAARRARNAGFDIVYVYAGHNMTVAQHFLLPRLNDRNDEYGGSLENRTRLIRELLEETHDEVGDSCAVAFRFAVDEMMGTDGMQAEEEGRAVVELLADLPDIWDVNVSGWENDSLTTRFGLEDGYQTAYIEFVKQVTGKPVVAVGRFTSPDQMVSMVKKGIVDFIGAARPSIADPFLPNKIQQDNVEQIRECIGCNICASSDTLGVPIRCTQNPTMGEEWRRSWHPEYIEPKASDRSVLIVGGGPAGLECTLQLARRGYPVTLAEASNELGGRVVRESGLKGLSAWRRVSDNRIYELERMENVEIYLDSELDAAQIVEFGASAVFIATGAIWRRDGIGRSTRQVIPGLENINILTPDDIMQGHRPEKGPVVIFDDEQGYIGGVIADHLAGLCPELSLLTSASVVSPFTAYTLEQARIQTRLLEQGTSILANRFIASVAAGEIETSCIYSGQRLRLPCRTLILVSQREAVNRVAEELLPDEDHPDNNESSCYFEVIGDAFGPGLIADAVFSGHLAARNFEADADEINAALFRRELTAIP